MGGGYNGEEKKGARVWGPDGHYKGEERRRTGASAVGHAGQPAAAEGPPPPLLPNAWASMHDGRRGGG